MGSVRQQQRSPEARDHSANPARRAAGPARTAPSPRYGFAPDSPRHRLAPADGLPEPLKTNVEAMSGLAMDDVRVHRNSSEPAKLGALAFTQGAEIHLGAGQERHLPHEAWHVVQQKQGRVTATRQMKGVGLNDDIALEREADTMGRRATGLPGRREHARPERRAAAPGSGAVVQRAIATAAEVAQKRQELAPIVYQLEEIGGHSYLRSATNVFRFVRQVRLGVPRGYWTPWDREERGTGQYGRMGTEPQSALATVAQSARFMARDTDSLLWSRLQTRPILTVVNAGANLGNDNARTMGIHFLDTPYFLARPISARSISAAAYADNHEYEWLHMHGHGLGGPNAADNLWAGSHAANSKMLALESAAGAARSYFPGQVFVDVTWLVDRNHHSDANCTTIANYIGEPPAQVIGSMADKDSHMLRHINYYVRSPVGSVSETVDPYQPGRYYQGEFDYLSATAFSTLRTGGMIVPTHRKVMALLAVLIILGLLLRMMRTTNRLEGSAKEL